jgi:hypothetical protein
MLTPESPSPDRVVQSGSRLLAQRVDISGEFLGSFHQVCFALSKSTHEAFILSEHYIYPVEVLGSACALNLIQDGLDQYREMNRCDIIGTSSTISCFVRHRNMFDLGCGKAFKRRTTPNVGRRTGEYIRGH